jgi:Ring finger domain
MERQTTLEHPRPPRRQIAEEDECWVCHEELPSRELTNFQDLRDSHVQACLVGHMARLGIPSSPSSSPPLSEQTPIQTTGPSQAGPSGTSSIQAAVPNTPEGRAAAREQAHAAVVLGQNRPSPGVHRFGGAIFPYKASEKDCVQQAECSICFEEYEPGQDMARLQCFCRFHLQCIRGWYTKMPGKCPLHDHDRGD